MINEPWTSEVREGWVSALSSTFTIASSFFLEEFGWEACMLAGSLAHLCSQVHIPPFLDSPKPSPVQCGGTDLLHHILQDGQEFLWHD